MLKKFATSSFNPFSSSPFSLKDQKGFPYIEWSNQKVIYNELKSWYTGEVLAEQITDQSTGKTTDRYPIKINPLKGTCAKHAAVLFGLTVDSMHLGGTSIQFIPDIADKESREKSKEVLKKVEKVLKKNNAGAIFIENGIVSQYMGGSVLAARWRPDILDCPIEISNPAPNEFFAIADGTNFYRLKEAWIVREIKYSEAKSYFPDIPASQRAFYYTEHWTVDEYEIAINGQTLKFGDTLAKGPNPFGVVPMVYIPHIRDSGFMGKSLITESVKGVIREMNLRFADIGDAISADSHRQIASRNVSGNIKTIFLADGTRILDLGSSQGMDGKDQPDLFAVNASSASEPMLKFAEELDAFYRRETDHPSVADGEDQGSQRSSLTLNTRMWPLVSHVELERSFWSIGLIAFAKIILKMMSIKGLDGVTEKDVETDIVIKWPPMLPRDREVLVNEVAIRSSSNIGSTRHLMSLFDDIEDPETMWDEIIEEKKAMVATEPKPVPADPPGSDKPAVSNVDAKSGVQKPPAGKTTKPASEPSNNTQ